MSFREHMVLKRLLIHTQVQSSSGPLPVTSWQRVICVAPSLPGSRIARAPLGSEKCPALLTGGPQLRMGIAAAQDLGRQHARCSYPPSSHHRGIPVVSAQVQSKRALVARPTGGILVVLRNRQLV